MSAAILSFARRGSQKSDWTDQELAEFYRVANALTQAGREVGTDRGRTDEGDPWFVFFQPATEDVIAHFARIDGEVIADASALAAPIRGGSLREVLDQVAEEYTLVLPKARRGKGFFVHPAALLAALVATALLEVEQASASRGGDTDAGRAGKGDGVRGSASGSGSGQAVVNPSARAVSFNDAGVVGESHFNASLLMSTIAAVLSLSAHTTAVAGEEPTTVAVTNVTVSDIQTVDAQLPAHSAGEPGVGLGEVPAMFGALSAPGRPAPAAERSDRSDPAGPANAGRDGRPGEGRSELVDVANKAADTLAQLPSDGGVATLAEGGTAAHAGVVPIIAFQAEPPAEKHQAETDEEAAGGNAQGASGGESDQAQGGAASEMAKAVEDFLESGSLSGVTFPNWPETDGKGADQGPQEDPEQASRDKVRADLKAALDRDGDDRPTPSDLIFDGPSSDHAALQALGDFFESGAYTVEQLSLGFASTEAGATGLSGQSPLLVAYKSDAPLMDAFTFMPGVVFVDEELVAPYTDTPGSAQFELQMTDANTVEILGFYAFNDALG